MTDMLCYAFDDVVAISIVVVDDDTSWRVHRGKEERLFLLRAFYAREAVIITHRPRE